MTVSLLITFHMLCALLFALTILDHQQVLQYVTLLLALELLIVNIMCIVCYVNIAVYD